MNILVLNSGSSSQKSALYQFGKEPPKIPSAPLWAAEIEWGSGKADFRVHNAGGISLSQKIRVKDRRAAIQRLLQSLLSGKTPVISGSSQIDVVGHRVVHGGHKLTEPTIVTTAVQRTITAFSKFAPLHNRAELQGIKIIAALAPRIPQVAVFDTGFHSDLPPAAAAYPGPYEWLDAGIRRYGFHGVNHQYCAWRAAQLLGKKLTSLKIVSCHLGNGCSLAAIRDGRSIETTMGFTPLEGLMMGTRSGSIDPGILTYLMRENRISGKRLDDVLNKKSGLFGISGLSNDMRQILAAMKNGNQRAQLAFDMYVHRLRAGIGAMAAALAGHDVLVFTAGVGEHSPEVRAAASENLEFLGVHLDPIKNRQSLPDKEISTATSKVRVLIICAQEDWTIAKACWRIMRTSRARREVLG